MIEFARVRKNRPGIGLIPLIDVAMFLLIFFMVAGTIEKFELIPVTPPKAASGKLMDEGHIVVLLGSHEELVVDDDLVDMPKLESVMKDRLAANPNKVITIKADSSIPAVRMIEVMERIRKAGGKHLSIATQNVPEPVKADGKVLSIPGGMARPAYYLTQRHFAWACMLALLLHVSGFAAWIMAPHQPVRAIPVRVLNIKLGEGDDIEITSAMEGKNTGPVEQALAGHLAEEEPVTPVHIRPSPAAPEKAPEKIGLAASQALTSALAQQPHQFVRQQTQEDSTTVGGKPAATTPTAPSAASGTGSTLGNSTATDAESIRRYEQLVSSWYWKFHFYPDEARQQQLQSKGVVRVEYDRQGNLRNSAVEHSTGQPILDRAMLEIAKRANPFPVVPENYKPSMPVVAFTIQVNFTLETKDAPK